MMSTKKHLCWFLVALVFFAVVSTGCGGGSSTTDSGNTKSSESTQSGNNNKTNQNQQTQNDNTNTTPQNTNGFSNTYSASEMTGTWVASSGSGVATGPDGVFSLIMTNCTATFDNINGADSSTSTSTTYVSASANWNAYQNNMYTRTIPLYYNNAFVEIRNIRANTWRYTFSGSGSTITATLTSETTADVVEEGNFGLGSYTYRYVATYTMTKRQ
ncbi:MAG: hypothetical protein IJU31_02205 [Synergistaceae bacterium]|nr:hypothetical protein [Synergistaceae bacterium]